MFFPYHAIIASSDVHRSTSPHPLLLEPANAPHRQIADDHQAKGVYSQDGVLPKVNSNVELIVGLFQDTLQKFLDEHPEPIAYLHMDADLYSSTKYVFDNIEDRIVSGTVISFDEVYNKQVYLDHEMKAWVEFANETEIRYKWITRTPHEQASLIIK